MLIFYFFAAALTFLGYRSLRGGIEFLNYFKQEFSKPRSNYTPFVSIIVPCRGLDIDLEKNLRSLLSQDYAPFEVIFVVDTEDDESVPVVRLVTKQSVDSPNSKIVIAGKSVVTGQKVHNLRKAVLEMADHSEVIVFMDSDARPSENWLSNLVAPLSDKNVGAATGYRWFVQKKGGLATHLRSVWNASIASTLGKNTRGNFCWGGSTAITRNVFNELDIRDRWKGTLSDDFTLTGALKKAGRPIHFVPQCLTATVEDCTFRELLEFTTRQMKITRAYAPDLFGVSFISSALFSATFWAGVGLLFFTTGFDWWLTIGFMLMIFGFGLGKAWIRLSAAKLALQNHKKEVQRQLLPQILLWTVTPILFFCNDIIALFSKKITWRGITYKLESANKTLIDNENG